jgi:predicted transcriptional regulator
MSSSRGSRPQRRKPDRSRAYGTAQPIDDFIRREKWQLADIEEGLRDAEKGDFATNTEVAATIAKYTSRKRSK